MQKIVVERHAHSEAIGVIDETSLPKKGDKTPGVQRQHCGATGKTDNCVVTVHLPADKVYQPKWQIALG